ncbi:MAG TPA: prolyl oligopeptidase family serine peptidase, partial [Vicinamibacterales bacterium]|nr:prolyl oligopeptidase family serine peptidase [Vicinamibacterales bacterium]
MPFSAANAFRLLSCGLALVASSASVQLRVLRPDDLFRYERIAGVVWSPDFSRAAVEIHRPRPFVGSRLSSAEIAVVDRDTAATRVIATPPADAFGFFNAAWSPDGQRLAFFSIGHDGSVTAWIWNGRDPAAAIDNLPIADALADPPLALWPDGTRVVVMARDPARPNSGSLYFAATRGRNVADEWQKALAGNDPAVAVFSSMAASDTSRARFVRLVSVDVETRAVTTLAEGALHTARLSADRRTISYRVETPAIPSAPASSFFGPDATGEAAYDRVNWGHEVRHIDARSGAPAAAPSPAPSAAAAKGQPTLRVSNTAAGTALILQREGQPDHTVWRGNAWLSEIATGRAESIAYRSTGGQPLTGWLLYPPDYVSGRRIPIVTMVYPGTVYGERQPSSFDLFNPAFNHPQLYAALGYGVLLPSIPESDTPMQVDGIAALAGSVLPLVDAVVARGIADPNRIAVTGQSAGGWATLGLITTTDRFRTAIASASYSNLTSLYGTFYGQYRYGDNGIAERAQL